MWVSMSACSQRGRVPTSELKEIRQLAFEAAAQRYALSNALIESKYQPRKTRPCSKQEESHYDPWADFSEESLESFNHGCERVIQHERKVLAVASVRGVELSPTATTFCLIRFDFEPSPNPHAELPENQATAERFEKPDGSHYWSIRWK
jgi:hypothetical protein